MNITPNTLRNILAQNGLHQRVSAHPRSINGSGFGDFSVRYQTNTTFSRRGVGYRTRQHSVRTGRIEIEVSSLSRQLEYSNNTIQSVLNSMGISFTRLGNVFII